MGLNLDLLPELNLDYDFDDETYLDDWWKQVEGNFRDIQNEYNSHTEEAGDEDSYGHLRLSSSVESWSDVSDGTAATPYAVKLAYDRAAEAEENACGEVDKLRTDVENKCLSVSRIKVSELYTESSSLMTIPDDSLASDFVLIHNDTAEAVTELRRHDDYAGIMSEPIPAGGKRLCKIYSLGKGGADPENGFVWVMPSSDISAGLRSLISAETAAREAADRVIETRIVNLENDPFKTVYDVTYLWSNLMPEPTIVSKGSDLAQVTIHLADRFIVNGVRCGTEKNTSAVLGAGGKVYVNVSFNIKTHEASLSVSDTELAGTVDDNFIWSFTIGYYDFGVYTDDDPDSPTLGQYIINITNSASNGERFTTSATENRLDGMFTEVTDEYIDRLLNPVDTPDNPVQEGNVTLSELSAGVYSINGNYRVTANDSFRPATTDMEFHVSSDGITCVSSGGVVSYKLNESGSYEEQSTTTVVSDEFIENLF